MALSKPAHRQVIALPGAWPRVFVRPRLSLAPAGWAASGWRVGARQDSCCGLCRATLPGGEDSRQPARVLAAGGRVSEPHGARPGLYIPCSHKGIPSDSRAPGTRGAHAPAADSWQPSPTRTQKVVRRSKRLEGKVFLGPSLPVRESRVWERGREPETCRFPRPPSPHGGPGQRAQGGYRAPGLPAGARAGRPGTRRGQLTMVTRVAVAPPPVRLPGSWRRNAAVS